MKVKRLLTLLYEIPFEAEIFLELGDIATDDFTIRPVTVSCDDPTIVGYMICENVPKSPESEQLSFDFEKDVN